MLLYRKLKKRRKSHNSLCNSIMMSSNFTRGRTSVQTNIDIKKNYNQQLLLDGIHQLHLIRSTNTKIVVKATSKQLAVTDYNTEYVRSIYITVKKAYAPVATLASVSLIFWRMISPSVCSAALSYAMKAARTISSCWSPVTKGSKFTS